MPEPTVLKRCPCAGHEGPNPVPASGFYRNIRSPDGLHFWCRTCVDRVMSRRTAAIREAVFAHYGRVCVCCGTDQMLGIDHVNGDGAEHRQELFGSNGNAQGMYRWLIANNFPGGFQVMCRACNSSKRSGPVCRLDHNSDGTTKTCRCPSHAGPNPLPITAFARDVTSKDGRGLWCKTCRRETRLAKISMMKSN